MSRKDKKGTRTKKFTIFTVHIGCAKGRGGGGGAQAEICAWLVSTPLLELRESRPPDTDSRAGVR